MTPRRSHDAVYLNVLRIPGGNTIAIVDAVKRVVEKLRDLRRGLVVKAVFDQSTFVRTTYPGLKKEITQALFLIGVVILVFLQSVRGTLIVSVAIPLSFAITLIVLDAANQTLNAFTLGGLTRATGRLVVRGASALLVIASGWAASRLPSTFLPEIDESMDMIYVRFTPGISLVEATQKLNAMGKAVSAALPTGAVEMVIPPSSRCSWCQ